MNEPATVPEVDGGYPDSGRRRGSDRRPPAKGPVTGPRRWLPFVAVAAGAMVIVAGTGFYLLATRNGGGGEREVPDGPTFYQALDRANVSADSSPGGPWTISQAYGVASPVPADPSVWGWGQYDSTFASCQSAFNGLTIWNGTIPLFSGTYNSGTAPFWQFVYFSNSTQQLLVVTDVRGQVEVFPAISMSSECAEASGLATQPWITTLTWGREGWPVDTSKMASADWNTAGRQYVTWLNRPVGELYLFGSTQFGSGQPVGDQLNFFTCGTVGAAGVTPGLALGGNNGANSFNYTLGCTPTASNWTAIPLVVSFSASTYGGASGSLWISQEFQFLDRGSPPYSGPGYDTRGVASWMIGVNLSNDTGRSAPLAPAGCASWVPSLGDCPATTTGWYAVLTAPGGGWLASYGASSTGPVWSSPVVPVVNNETLTVFAPSGGNTSGDTLRVASTTVQLPPTGSVTLS